MKILALDFETADYQADSACALGLAMIDDGKIVRTHTTLIRPPRRWFQFTYIHGIAWEDVKDKPTFGEQWDEVEEWFEEADFFVAHNAPFDRGVLNACCRSAGILPPRKPFLCTVRLSRSLWQLKPAALPNVCEHFGIALNHHDAGSDTLACAHIMIHALASISRAGLAPADHLHRYALKEK